MTEQHCISHIWERLFSVQLVNWSIFNVTENENHDLCSTVWFSSAYCCSSRQSLEYTKCISRNKYPFLTARHNCVMNQWIYGLECGVMQCICVPHGWTLWPPKPKPHPPCPHSGRWDGISVPYSFPAGHTPTQWGITGFSTTQYVHCPLYCMCFTYTYFHGVKCTFLPQFGQVHLIIATQTEESKLCCRNATSTQGNHFVNIVMQCAPLSTKNTKCCWTLHRTSLCASKDPAEQTNRWVGRLLLGIRAGSRIRAGAS